MTPRRAFVTSRRLGEAGVRSPEYDAVELFAHVLGVDRATFLAREAIDPLPMSAEQEASLEELVRRRAAREPLQHLLGSAAFRTIEVAVGPGVFVPRPETELLAGWAVDACAVLEAPIVVDLCTGSGAIAKAIAHEVPHALVHAAELDPGAHEWAERNLAGTGVQLSLGDLADAFGELVGTVDVITCNPPYIPLEAWESIDLEVRDHDPATALFSGADGLDAMRALERRAATLLRPGGLVGAEHADVQGESAPAVFRAAGRWRDVTDHVDLAGRARFLTARLAP
ncbi:MAG: peptide chain release factor N(5)-glutamine methyltransferase [Nocardioides sp.]